MFEETTSTRSEIYMLSYTIVDLYSCQIAMDEQVRSILHSQKVQQRVAIVNAILACILFPGGVATYLLSGSTAVMTDVAGEAFAVSGLVESLFGIGKDWSSFTIEPDVEWFFVQEMSF